MAFNKRRKQPHLFRDPSVDPTKQVRLQLATVEASPVEPVAVVSKRKPARKRATKH